MAPKPVTYTAPTDSQMEAVQGNVRLVTEHLSGLAGESLPPGRDGVVFLDRYIDQFRETGDPALRDQLAHMTACYLGESMIVEIGGRWVNDSEYGLGVQLAPEVVAFVFNKTEKHFADTEESVLGFFDTIAAIAPMQRNGTWPPNPSPEQDP